MISGRKVFPQPSPDKDGPLRGKHAPETAGGHKQVEIVLVPAVFHADSGVGGMSRTALGFEGGASGPIQSDLEIRKEAPYGEAYGGE
jgi:hypothetical protein